MVFSSLTYPIISGQNKYSTKKLLFFFKKNAEQAQKTKEMKEITVN
ncbi:hypothetical protein SAMN04488101_11121 [Pedobacter nyackensis]|uniref:Uncharacterized protein n=1 Tax=Pedobacter nyackensis TaxID=475255 RepID=A0A1W2EAT0_9SPHI|nr:hypothetical protein SAMN04488101_11121 [Pedobacter nyackensis]